MSSFEDRTRALIGDAALEKLKKSRVLLFGLGGVGGSCCEALARAGVGELFLVDGDRVSVTNINRQTAALRSTLGQYKTQVMEHRVKDISENINVSSMCGFYTSENDDCIDFSGFDYVIDAIDMVSAKLLIAKKCSESNVPLISCMGTGNRLDPTKFTVCDIYETSGCPLARVMRHELRKMGIERLKVVFSTETPRDSHLKDKNGKTVPASISFVPPAAGLLLAGTVIRDLTGD